MGNICDIFKRENQNETIVPIIMVSTPGYIPNDISNNIQIGKPINNNYYEPSKPISIIGNSENNLQQTIKIPQTNEPIIIYNSHPYPYHPADNFGSGMVGGLIIEEMLDNERF